MTEHESESGGTIQEEVTVLLRWVSERGWVKPGLVYTQFWGRRGLLSSPGRETYNLKTSEDAGGFPRETTSGGEGW